MGKAEIAAGGPSIQNAFEGSSDCAGGGFGLGRRIEQKEAKKTKIGSQRLRFLRSLLFRPSNIHVGILIQQLDGVAFANHSFREHGAIDTSHAFVCLRDGFQYRRRFFRRVGIECDHHATPVALENRDGYF